MCRMPSCKVATFIEIFIDLATRFLIYIYIYIYLCSLELKVVH